ncbi:MAG: hypothetical protein RMZ43_001880 [Nostoc sp. CmiVER01]|uniref:hypothetical protein n=1 Tax=Nostoc sp. CmiVER01 TaxID=3075384 RepID=UPI002AD23AA5|nr:hypothetical protein [Nostoc sp. CmiVER01]MDZ8122466.1 hypothetical protein [Nostoc sp. CmiVER01]
MTTSATRLLVRRFFSVKEECYIFILPSATYSSDRMALSFIKASFPQLLRKAEEYTSLISRQGDHWLRFTYGRLNMVLQVHLGDITQKRFVVIPIH